MKVPHHNCICISNTLLYRFSGCYLIHTGLFLFSVNSAFLESYHVFTFPVLLSLCIGLRTLSHPFFFFQLLSFCFKRFLKIPYNWVLLFSSIKIVMGKFSSFTFNVKTVTFKLIFLSHLS